MAPREACSRAATLETKSNDERINMTPKWCSWGFVFPSKCLTWEGVVCSRGLTAIVPVSGLNQNMTGISFVSSVRIPPKNGLGCAISWGNGY